MLPLKGETAAVGLGFVAAELSLTEGGLGTGECERPHRQPDPCSRPT